MRDLQDEELSFVYGAAGAGKRKKRRKARRRNSNSNSNGRRGGNSRSGASRS